MSSHRLAALEKRTDSFFRTPNGRRVRRVGSAALKCLLTIFLVGIITASIVACVVAAYIVSTYKDIDIPDLNDLSLNESSVIYVKNASGEDVEFQRVEGANSVWKSIDEIPENMQNAVIAIEDKRFYKHHGVDWQRTIAATVNQLLGGGSFGGSTITQQLIKNVTNDNEVSIPRKIREIFRALELEKTGATKQQVLEAYLNILPLSGNIQGVGAAANYYFAKDVKDLTLAECAVIAGITQNPSKYNPYTHPDNVRQRQRVILAEMYKNEMITEDEYRQAYNQELVYKSNMRKVGQQDYYTDLLTEDVIAALMDNYGLSREAATNRFYLGGLKIYSAEDPAMQEKAEAIYANDANFPAHLKNDVVDPQSAIVVLDYSGRVVVTVGGRGEKEGNRILNRGTDSTRQPGSSIKPIATYAPSIELNLVTFSTIVQDQKITLRDGSKWPNNYGNSHYGSMPLVQALQRSLNTIPAQLMQKLTPERSFDFITKKMHLSTLVKSARVGGKVSTDMDFSPLTLGGLTYGVKTIDMAAAFQTFGNGGVYNKPYTFYKVTDKDGQVILENTSTNERAISEDTAYVMNRLLQKVVDSKPGTAVGQKIGSLETFGKTGTTSGTDNGERDVYFVGGTPYYVGACWFGYDNNQNLYGTKQKAGAKTLWKLVMDMLHAGLSDKTFDKKGSTVEARYCTATGLLARSGCPDTAVGVYKADNLPGLCTAHGGDALDAAGHPVTTAPADTTAAPAESTTAPQSASGSAGTSSSTTGGGSTTSTTSEPADGD